MHTNDTGDTTDETISDLSNWESSLYCTLVGPQREDLYVQLFYKEPTDIYRKRYFNNQLLKGKSGNIKRAVRVSFLSNQYLNYTFKIHITYAEKFAAGAFVQRLLANTYICMELKTDKVHALRDFQNREGFRDLVLPMITKIIMNHD